MSAPTISATATTAREAVQVGRAYLVRHFPARCGNHRPGHQQGHADAGLVGRALGARRIEAARRGQLHAVDVGAVVAHHHHHGVGPGRVVIQRAVLRPTGQPRFDQQAADLPVHGLDHQIGDQAVIHHADDHARRAFHVGKRGTDQVVVAARRIFGDQRQRRHLQGRMDGRIAQGQHPGLVPGLGCRPGDGAIGLQGAAVATCGCIVGQNFTGVAVAVAPDELAGVIAVLGHEVDVIGRAGLAGMAGIEDAAALQAGATRCPEVGGIVAYDHLAAFIDEVAGAAVGAVDAVHRRVGHEAATVGAVGSIVAEGGQAGTGVDRVGRTVEVTVEVIPAQRPHGLQAVGQVGRGAQVGAGQVHLADQGAGIADGFQQLGQRHLVGRDFRVGQVGLHHRVEDVGAGRVAPGEEGRTRRRAGGHGPGIAELQAGFGDGRQIRRSGWRDAAIAVEVELVQTEIVDDDEQDVGRLDFEAIGENPIIIVLRHSQGCGQEEQRGQKQHGQRTGQALHGGFLWMAPGHCAMKASAAGIGNTMKMVSEQACRPGMIVCRMARHPAHEPAHRAGSHDASFQHPRHRLAAVVASMMPTWRR